LKHTHFIDYMNKWHHLEGLCTGTYSASFHSDICSEL